MSKTLDEMLNIVYRSSESESPYRGIIGSLVLGEVPKSVGPDIVKADRGRESLVNEYFAQEVFAALGMPVPFSVLLLEPQGTKVASKQVDANIRNSINLSYQFPRESMVTQFLAEAVIQDGDGLASAAEGDNQWVEKDLTLVRVTYDRERASAKTLKEETLEEILKKLREAHAVYSVTGERVFSTTEQELSMISRLMDIEKNKALFYIFHNPKVSATEQFKPPKVEEEYLEELEKAWATNIKILSEYYLSKYDIKAFRERETVRNELADQVIKRLADPSSPMASYFSSPSFKQEILERLRARQYFEYPDQIKRSDLSNPVVIERIVSEEQARGNLLKLSQNCDKVIFKLLGDPSVTDNQSKYAKKLYQHKTEMLDKIVKSKLNERGRLQSLSMEDIDKVSPQFEKNIAELFEDMQAIDKIKKLVEGLADQKIEIEAMLSNGYGDVRRVYEEMVKENVSKGIGKLRRQLYLEFGYHFFRNRPDKLKELIGKHTNENIFSEFEPGINWDTLGSAITDKGNIVNTDAVQAVLQSLKREYLRSPTISDLSIRAMIKEVSGFFNDDIPKEDVQKIQFLEHEIDLLFLGINNELHEAEHPLYPVGPAQIAFKIDDCYRDVGKFLKTADRRFNNMVARLGLSEKAIEAVREKFETHKNQLHKKWEDRIPEIRAKMVNATATDTICGIRFLADLFPSNFFASSKNVGLRAFTSFDCLLTPKDNHETNFGLSIHPDNLGFMEFGQGPPIAFNKELGEICVQYYTALFHAYANGGEIPKISLISPKTQDDFKKNLYLLNIEFKDKKQKEYFLETMCKDCYDPSLGWEIWRMNISPDSKAASVQKDHLKRLSELSVAVPINDPQSLTTQGLTFSDEGRMAAGGLVKSSLQPSEGASEKPKFTIRT